MPEGFIPESAPGGLLFGFVSRGLNHAHRFPSINESGGFLDDGDRP